MRHFHVLCLLALACAPGCGTRDAATALENSAAETADNLAGTPPDPQGNIPTPDEAGLLNSGLWLPQVGAFRGLHKIEGQFKAAAGDNALMLWALANGRYTWARRNGWSAALRDYLISTEKDGLFSPGHLVHPATGKVTAGDPRCSPAVETMVLFGVIADQTRDQRHLAFVERVAAVQHQRVVTRDAGSRQVACESTDTPHDFTRVGNRAFHLANMALLARLTNKPVWRRNAEKAWERLAENRDGDLFDDSNLRNLQTAWALNTALNAGIRPAGLESARNALLRKVRITGQGVQVGNAAPTSDTMALAYVTLVFRNRTPAVDLLKANVRCTPQGLTWAGKAGRDRGPLEDQALGFLAGAKMLRKGWLTPKDLCEK